MVEEAAGVAADVENALVSELTAILCIDRFPNCEQEYPHQKETQIT